jgi:hypothetical protein
MELKEEIRAHLEIVTWEKINDGLSPEEARYAAQREFGSGSGAGAAGLQARSN